MCGQQPKHKPQPVDRDGDTGRRGRDDDHSNKIDPKKYEETDDE